MKRTVLFLAVVLAAWACEGPQGEVGPTGAKGQTGDKGATGAQGPAGTNAVMPKIYDFTLDLSKPLASFSPKTPLGALDVPIIYIKTNKTEGYSPLPFKGYAYTADNIDFLKLDVTYQYYSNSVYFDNTTGIPPGASFLMRMIVITGVKGARIDPNTPYDEMKRKYNF